MAKLEKGKTEAVLVDEIKKDEENSLDQSRVESIIDKRGEIKLSDDAEAESRETVAEEKYISVHKTEISVAFIPVEEIKEEVASKSSKQKKEKEDLQASVKHHKIYHTKEKSDDEGEPSLPQKQLKRKKKKGMISKLIPDFLMPYRSFHFLTIFALQRR